MRARRIPLIACQSSRAHSLALLVRAFVPDVAIVVHRRVDYPPNASWWSRRKYLSRHVARYICVSDAVRRVLRDFGIPEDRLVTVHDAVNPGAHTGLDRRAIRERLAAAWSIPPETTIVGNIAYLTVQKGHDTLLRALAALRIMGRRVFCYIAGAGPLEAELRRLAAELGLGDADVRFLGVRGDVPELLAATDVFALSSNDEGLGTSLLDAAHAGCALVATRVGGIPEVVVDERTGLLAPPRDPAAFARQLARVGDDRALRLALGAAAREHAATDFSWGAMVDGTLAVYAAVIERAEDEKTRGREDERPGRAAGRTRNR